MCAHVCVCIYVFQHFNMYFERLLAGRPPPPKTWETASRFCPPVARLCQLSSRFGFGWLLILPTHELASGVCHLAKNAQFVSFLLSNIKPIFNTKQNCCKNKWKQSFEKKNRPKILATAVMFLFSLYAIILLLFSKLFSNIYKMLII